MESIRITAPMMEILAQFDAEGMGRLVSALYLYAADGVLPELDGVIRFGWIPLRQAVDAQIAEHERKAAAGRQGGRPAKAAAPVENPPAPVENLPEKADESREKQKKADESTAFSACAYNNIISLSLPVTNHNESVLSVKSERELLKCPSLYTRYLDWFREFGSEGQVSRLGDWLARFGRFYSTQQINCAFAFVERKAAAGKLRDPLSYLISTIYDWHRRGLKTREEIAQYLDIPWTPAASG